MDNRKRVVFDSYTTQSKNQKNGFIEDKKHKEPLHFVHRGPIIDPIL